MENDPNQEPKPLSEILQDPEALIGELGDPERTREAAATFATFEVRAIEEERMALLASIEEDPANDTTETRERITEINKMLLTAQADRTDIERNYPGTEPGK